MNKSQEINQLKVIISKLHRHIIESRSPYVVNIDYAYALNKAGEFTLRCDHFNINSPLVRKQLDATKNICWYYLLKEERNGTK